MTSDDTTITVEKCKDSGLALVLICLLAYQAWKLPVLMGLAIVFLLVAMTYPIIFQPFAKLWFGLSMLLGTISVLLLCSAAPQAPVSWGWGGVCTGRPNSSCTTADTICSGVCLSPV